MHTEIQNRYTMTDDMIKEYVHRTQSLTYIIVGIVVILGAIARLIINAVNHITDNTVLYIIAAVGGVFLIFGAPMMLAKELIHTDKKRFKNKRPQTVIKFSDVISKKEGPDQDTCEYSDIVKVVIMKRSIALMTGPKKGFLLARDGFYNGTEAELLAYLKEMCPGVKGL